MQIIIYSTATSVYCRKLKEYLTSKQLSFTEKFVDSDDNAQNEMSDLSNGYLGVPVTLIIKDDGKRETVIGFDLERFGMVFGTN